MKIQSRHTSGLERLEDLARQTPFFDTETASIYKRNRDIEGLSRFYTTAVAAADTERPFSFDEDKYWGLPADVKSLYLENEFFNNVNNIQFETEEDKTKFLEERKQLTEYIDDRYAAARLDFEWSNMSNTLKTWNTVWAGLGTVVTSFINVAMEAAYFIDNLYGDRPDVFKTAGVGHITSKRDSNKSWLDEYYESAVIDGFNTWKNERTWFYKSSDSRLIGLGDQILDAVGRMAWMVVPFFGKKAVSTAFMGKKGMAYKYANRIAGFASSPGSGIYYAGMGGRTIHSLEEFDHVSHRDRINHALGTMVIQMSANMVFGSAVFGNQGLVKIPSVFRRNRLIRFGQEFVTEGIEETTAEIVQRVYDKHMIHRDNPEMGYTLSFDELVDIFIISGITASIMGQYKIGFKKDSYNTFRTTELLSDLDYMATVLDPIKNLAQKHGIKNNLSELQQVDPHGYAAAQKQSAKQIKLLFEYTNELSKIAQRRGEEGFTKLLDIINKAETWDEASRYNLRNIDEGKVKLSKHIESEVKKFNDNPKNRQSIAVTPMSNDEQQIVTYMKENYNLDIVIGTIDYKADTENNIPARKDTSFSAQTMNNGIIVLNPLYTANKSRDFIIREILNHETSHVLQRMLSNLSRENALESVYRIYEEVYGVDLRNVEVDLSPYENSPEAVLAAEKQAIATAASELIWDTDAMLPEIFKRDTTLFDDIFSFFSKKSRDMKLKNEHDRRLYKKVRAKVKAMKHVSIDAAYNTEQFLAGLLKYQKLDVGQSTNIKEHNNRVQVMRMLYDGSDMFTMYKAFAEHGDLSTKKSRDALFKLATKEIKETYKKMENELDLYELHFRESKTPFMIPIGNNTENNDALNDIMEASSEILDGRIKNYATASSQNNFDAMVENTIDYNMLRNPQYYKKSFVDMVIAYAQDNVTSKNKHDYFYDRANFGQAFDFYMAHKYKVMFNPVLEAPQNLVDLNKYMTKKLDFNLVMNKLSTRQYQGNFVYYFNNEIQTLGDIINFDALSKEYNNMFKDYKNSRLSVDEVTVEQLAVRGYFNIDDNSITVNILKSDSPEHIIGGVDELNLVNIYNKVVSTIQHEVIHYIQHNNDYVRDLEYNKLYKKLLSNPKKAFEIGDIIYGKTNNKKLRAYIKSIGTRESQTLDTLYQQPQLTDSMSEGQRLTELQLKEGVDVRTPEARTKQYIATLIKNMYKVNFNEMQANFNVNHPYKQNMTDIIFQKNNQILGKGKFSELKVILDDLVESDTSTSELATKNVFAEKLHSGVKGLSDHIFTQRLVNTQRLANIKYTNSMLEQGIKNLRQFADIRAQLANTGKIKIFGGAMRASTVNKYKDFVLTNDLYGKHKPDIVGDVVEVPLDNYQILMATPTCNYYTTLRRNLASQYALNTRHLLPVLIKKYAETGKPFIIENVINQRRMANFLYNLPKGVYFYKHGRHSYFTNVELPLLQNVYQRHEYVKDLKNSERQGGFNVEIVLEHFIDTVLGNDTTRTLVDAWRPTYKMLSDSDTFGDGDIELHYKEHLKSKTEFDNNVKEAVGIDGINLGTLVQLGFTGEFINLWSTGELFKSAVLDQVLSTIDINSGESSIIGTSDAVNLFIQTHPKFKNNKIKNIFDLLDEIPKFYKYYNSIYNVYPSRKDAKAKEFYEFLNKNKDKKIDGFLEEIIKKNPEGLGDNNRTAKVRSEIFTEKNDTGLELENIVPKFLPIYRMLSRDYTGTVEDVLNILTLLHAAYGPSKRGFLGMDRRLVGTNVQPLDIETKDGPARNVYKNNENIKQPDFLDEDGGHYTEAGAETQSYIRLSKSTVAQLNPDVEGVEAKKYAPTEYKKFSTIKDQLKEAILGRDLELQQKLLNEHSDVILNIQRKIFKGRIKTQMKNAKTDNDKQDIYNTYVLSKGKGLGFNIIAKFGKDFYNELTRDIPNPRDSYRVAMNKVKKLIKDKVHRYNLQLTKQERNTFDIKFGDLTKTSLDFGKIQAHIKKLAAINERLLKTRPETTTFKTDDMSKIIRDNKTDKKSQYEIIKKFNPAPNDTATWIRSEKDILTFFETTLDDSNIITTPDFTQSDIKKALKLGVITVYSSNPIIPGTFVTPSYQTAKDYAGGGKIFKLRVKLTDVAWIDSHEGQYVKITNDDVKTLKKTIPEVEKELERQDTQDIKNREAIILADKDKTANKEYVIKLVDEFLKTAAGNRFTKTLVREATGEEVDRQREIFDTEEYKNNTIALFPKLNDSNIGMFLDVLESKLSTENLPKILFILKSLDTLSTAEAIFLIHNIEFSDVNIRKRIHNLNVELTRSGGQLLNISSKLSVSESANAMTEQVWHYVNDTRNSADIEGQIFRASEQIQNLQTQIHNTADNINAEIESHKNKIHELEKELSDASLNTEKRTEIKNNIKQREVKITELEKELKTTIEELTSKITTLEAEIEKLAENQKGIKKAKDNYMLNQDHLVSRLGDKFSDMKAFQKTISDRIAYLKEKLSPDSSNYENSPSLRKKLSKELDLQILLLSGVTEGNYNMVIDAEHELALHNHNFEYAEKIAMAKGDIFAEMIRLNPGKLTLEKAAELANSIRMSAMLSNPATWLPYVGRNYIGNFIKKGIHGTTKRLAAFFEETATGKEQSLIARRFYTNKSISGEVDGFITRNFVDNKRADYIFLTTKGKYDKITGNKGLGILINKHLGQIFRNPGDSMFKKSLNRYARFVSDQLSNEDTRTTQVEFIKLMKMGLEADREGIINRSISRINGILDHQRTPAEKQYLELSKNRDSAEFKQIMFDQITDSDMDVLMDYAFNEALTAFFKNDNIFTRGLAKARSSHWVLGLALSIPFPFARSASNFSIALYNYSPLQWINVLIEMHKRGTVDSIDNDSKYRKNPYSYNDIYFKSAQATLGTTFFLLGAMLAQLNIIRFDEEDYYGASIYIGDDFKIRMSDMSSTLAPVAIGAALRLASQEEDMDKGFNLFANNLSQQTIMGSFDNIFRARTAMDFTTNLFETYFTQFIPTVLRNSSRALASTYGHGGTKMKSRNFALRVLENVIDATPFRFVLPDAINPYTGEVIQRYKNPFLGELSSIVFGPRFKINNFSEAQKLAMKYGVKTTGLSGRFIIDGKEITLNNREKSKYNKVRGNYVYHQMEALMNNDITIRLQQENGSYEMKYFSNMTPEEKERAIRGIYSKATNFAKMMYWVDEGNRYVFKSRQEMLDYTRFLTVRKSDFLINPNHTGSRFVKIK